MSASETGLSPAKVVDKVNYKAWAQGLITFIREKGLEQECTDWHGGWKCPVESAPRHAALLAVLRDAEAVMAKSIYPKPDVGPDHPWSVLQRVRAALEQSHD